MKVRELIKKLKKMPQDLDVYYSHHDNSEWERAGEVASVEHCENEDYRKMAESSMDRESKDMFYSNPEEWVIIRG